MRGSARAAVAVTAVGLLSFPLILPAQSPFDSTRLLAAVRGAAVLAPGDLPTRINFVSPHSGIRLPTSYAVEGEPRDSFTVIYPVFQIRFPRGWIIAESALDRAFFPAGKDFSDAKYDSVQQAMRRAKLVVVTHEH